MSGSTTLPFGGDSPVSLGDFVFQGFEVPETVVWGGSQQLAVHKLIGGTRVIDAMGRDDADIQFSGVLLSVDASDRADDLDQLRVQGQPLPLIFLDRYYTVLVRSVTLNQKKAAHVPFRIICTVLEDQSSSPAPAYDSSQVAVSDDLDSAAAIEPTPELEGVPVILAPAQATMASAASLDAATQASDTALAQVYLAQRQVNSAASAANATLDGLAAATLAGAMIGVMGDATTTLTAFLAAADAAATAATAATMGAYLGRASANLGNL